MVLLFISAPCSNPSAAIPARAAPMTRYPLFLQLLAAAASMVDFPVPANPITTDNRSDPVTCSTAAFCSSLRKSNSFCTTLFRVLSSTPCDLEGFSNSVAMCFNSSSVSSVSRTVKYCLSSFLDFIAPESFRYLSNTAFVLAKC